MKIKKVELKNFKFHSNLKFDFGQQNCLIYGENGSGKSSIYWALYSLFKTYFRNKDFNFQKFKKNSSNQNLESKVTFDNNIVLKIPNQNYNLSTNISLENKRTIYFANQDILESISNNENFYLIIINKLRKYFETLDNFYKNFEYINSSIDETNYKEKNDEKDEINKKFEIFLNQLQLRVNDIINNCFEEKFIIHFNCEWGESTALNYYKYPTPQIALKIDEKDNLKLNFNEAKLKLTSIAIFFALIKFEEDKNNELKLLVLDDFLTSLDMANRHYIIEYIFENFKDYQKIIFTHNLQFYNLIIKLLKSKNEDENWDIKNIFLREENNSEVAIIYNKDEDYLKVAKQELLNGEFGISGNYSRKEFERIINEFKQLLEIGKMEQLNNTLGVLKSDNNGKFYKRPFKLLNNLNTRYININNIIESNENINAKVGKIRYELNQIKQFLEIDECELSDLKELLNKTEFYKDTIFNPASHSNEEIEIYRKECINSIKLLEELNKLLDSLR